MSWPARRAMVHGACGHPGGQIAARRTPRRSQEEVERYFTTNALAFVVGWSWIVFLRDTETLLAGLVTDGPNWQRLGFLGEGLVVGVFGPVLTFILLKAKLLSFSTLCCSATALGRLPPTPTAPTGGALTLKPLIKGGELDEALSESVRRLMRQLDGPGSSSSGSSSEVYISRQTTLPLVATERRVVVQSPLEHDQGVVRHGLANGSVQAAPADSRPVGRTPSFRSISGGRTTPRPEGLAIGLLGDHAITSSTVS